MGCDIHGWVEKVVDGKWVAIKELKDRSRSYQRFGKLAGVRQEGPEAKGVPEDVSETVAFWIKHDGSDGHSHSYLDLNTAFEIFKSSKEQGYYSLWDMCDLDSDSMDFDNCRLVFWFDN